MGSVLASKPSPSSPVPVYPSDPSVSDPCMHRAEGGLLKHDHVLCLGYGQLHRARHTKTDLGFDNHHCQAYRFSHLCIHGQTKVKTHTCFYIVDPVLAIYNNQSTFYSRHIRSIKTAHLKYIYLILYTYLKQYKTFKKDANEASTIIIQTHLKTDTSFGSNVSRSKMST